MHAIKEVGGGGGSSAVQKGLLEMYLVRIPVYGCQASYYLNACIERLFSKLTSKNF